MENPFKNKQIKRVSNKGKPNSGRAALVQEIVDELFTGSKKDFARINHQQGAQVTPVELREMFDRARRWPVNPPALFNKLLKQKVEDIKNQLKAHEKNSNRTR